MGIEAYVMRPLIILTAAQAKAIASGDSDEYPIKDKTEFVSDGDYEVRKIIFESEGKFYELLVRRAGSEFTEWSYGWDYQDKFKCPEVRPVQVLVTRWDRA